MKTKSGERREESTEQKIKEDFNGVKMGGDVFTDDKSDNMNNQQITGASNTQNQI